MAGATKKKQAVIHWFCMGCVEYDLHGCVRSAGLGSTSLRLNAVLPRNRPIPMAAHED